MIENAHRQALLVILVTIAALLASLFSSPPLGVDLKGGTQLIYEVPKEVLQEIADADPNATPDQIMEQTVSIIRERIDPQGTLDALVSRRGETGILIELPAMEKAQQDAVEDRIESLGKLEMRIVATDDFDEDGVRFNIDEEANRLRKWLDEQGGRELLKDDPANIRIFNALPPDQGGILSQGNLLWYVRIIEPSKKTPELWDYSFARPQGGEGIRGAVAAFTDEEWNGGRVPENLEKKQLLELIPINMKETYFTGEDLEPSGVRAGIGRDGSPAVDYLITAERAGEYADWSEKYKGKRSAIILNGIVKSAPEFIDRIPGRGQITGQFTNAEVEELVKVLRTGSLKVEPERQSVVRIGPTLGAQSIRRGLLSIVGGGSVVLAFILFYYRLAGIVAFIALALNVLLIWGVMMLLQATLTLPGIAGMVLTMGMAVDANILIYERIREEVKRGKDLLRAIRTGFEKAMSAILDSNITTFLAGVVLYNVGVGPIRGFAVTLMVGIVTTLFTAFFVSRLIFHYLLVSKKLKDFRVAGWLSDAKFDFVSKAKYAAVFSIVLILGGLSYSFTVPRETKLGLDFTGGANMQVVFEQPKTAEYVRQKLKDDPEFTAKFFEPAVNTVETRPDGTSNKFNLRIKLTDELREQIAQERRQAHLQKEAAEAEGKVAPDYVPPYIRDLERIFAGELVDPAFSDPKVTIKPDNPAQAFAEITLHFATPVSVEAVRAKLESTRKFPDLAVSVVGDENATQGKDLILEWTELSTTRPNQLFGLVRDALGDLKDVEGNDVVLSDPFPEAEEIGGRMVGELRNAAIGAMVLAMVLIVFYIRIRFHEYKYGIAAVVALVHDLLVSFGLIVLFNSLGLVSAEINLAMIAAFLTIVGYSVNDTIIIFDRIRENLSDQERLGDTKESFPALINRSINQTLSRTILTSGTTMFVVLVQFVINYGSGSDLEGFSFALVLGILTGTYSTIFIASPIVIWLRDRELARAGGGSGGAPQVAKAKVTAEPVESPS